MSYKYDRGDEAYLDAMKEILRDPPLSGVSSRPNQILPHVYIGSQDNAEQLKLLRELGITHVLNCAGYKGQRKGVGLDYNPYEEFNIKYLEFRADDSEVYDMSQHFNEAFLFLDRAKRTNGIVLVHCAMGINRSGVITAAYYLRETSKTLLESVTYIKNKRKVVLVNQGFQKQLLRYAKRIFLLGPPPPTKAEPSKSYSLSTDLDNIRSKERTYVPPRIKSRGLSSRYSTSPMTYQTVGLYGSGVSDTTSSSLPRRDREDRLTHGILMDKYFSFMSRENVNV